MSELIKVLILAAVQGVAEFLPISSSGHLVIFYNLLGIGESDVMTLSVVLHAGTLLAILIYYRNILFKIITKRDYKCIMLVVVSTIPIVIVGFALKASGAADKIFNSLWFPGFGLIITAFVILFGVMRKRENDKEINDLSFLSALWIGLAQSLAILPGVSRSGTTISSALKLGVKGEDAATYSFLLAIPAIAGATTLEVISGIRSGEMHFHDGELTLFAIGFSVSAVVGYFSLNLLIKILKKNKLSYFAYYCLVLGVSIIGWKIFTLG